MYKTVRIYVYVKRFIQSLKCKLRKEKVQWHDATKELRDAEHLLISNAQKTHYGDIFDYFQKLSKRPIPTLVKQLKLYIENNLIRCKGRLEKTKLSSNSKNPILLPRKFSLTNLIIKQYHEHNLRYGVNSVLASLGDKYWIPKARTTIKSVTRSCVKCLKVQGRAYPSPPAPPLPSDRVHNALPFSITGVDYTGAINVRDSGNITKHYIVLFTCAVSRAVHLEVVENNSSGE